ncbi:HNH endonuclease signature motif containing protein, partial [Brevibacterium luteolum]
LAHALDVTSNTAWSRVTGAATAFIGLPKLTAKVRAGKLSFDRFTYAASQAATIDPTLLGQLDTLLASITATKKSVYFSEVKAAIAALVTRAEQAQQIRERRRVEAFYDQHGRGTLIVQGPSHEIALLHARLEGMARCVVRGYTAGFDLPDNHVFADSRSFEQLKYDFLIGATIGGDVNTLDLAQEALAKRQESSGHTSSPLDPLADDLADLLSDTPISCPASGQWLARQAKITITVPAMALTDGPAADELPGSVDGSPISADVARQLVGSAGDTVYRLLTDPNTGEVLDHVATTYTISARMRHALVARWRYCTAPGCDRPATKAELDHIEPFNHRHPTRGGPTSMENLHPLCKHHHQLKTQGVFRLRREPRTGVLTWTLPGGTTATTHPPGSVLHRRHAELIANTTPAEPHQPGSPDPHNEPNDGLFSPAEACPS